LPILFRLGFREVRKIFCYQFQLVLGFFQREERKYI
jgi:hypothetical protein